MSCRSLCRWIVGVALVLAPASMHAQGVQTGIVGRISDSSGGVLPGVTIIATNLATGVTRTTDTDSEGAYSITSLIAGSYDVRAELSGFRTTVRQEVPVVSGNAVRVDMTLEIGAVGETVEVKADATARILRTEDTTLGLVLGEAQVQGLPVKNRNFMALAQLAPGASESVTGNQNTLGRSQPLNLSVHGQRHFDNNIRLDGASIIAGFVNGSTFVPSLEVLSEVSVQTGQYGAAYGMFSGAQVDMIVKSGQNDPHGSGFYYFRDDALTARRYFDVADPPPFDFGQFGATFGGPIVPNRAFFFVGYEGTRADRQTTGTATTAPQSFRNGDFSALSTRILDPFTGQQFPGNIIPANRIAPQAQALLQYIPLPNREGLSNNYIGTSESQEREHQFFVRVDHQFAPGTSIFGRGAFRNATNDTIQLNPNFRSLAEPENQHAVIGLTHTISSRTLLEARVAYARESSPNRTGREGADIDPLRDFGIGGLNVSDPLLRGIPSAGITGYMGTGETFANPRLLYTSPGAQAHLVYELTGHSIRTGVEAFRRNQDFYSVNARNQGSFSFTGLLTGNAFADFLLGLPDQTGRIENLARVSLAQDHVQGYVQDDWRISANFTVNAGLRYEFAGDYSDELGIARNLDLDTLQLFPEPATSGPLNEPSHDWAPRFGMTYRLTDDTVVRGGYGIYITQPTMANVALMFRNPPFNREDTFNTNRSSPNLTLANGFPQTSGGSTAPPTITTIPVDYGPGRAHVYSANLQHRLQGGWVAEIGYVGSQSRRLDNAWTFNTPPPGPGAVQARRPIQQYGDIRVFGTDGEAEYNGLQLRAQNLDFYGLNMLTSYTWSRCMDTRSSPATSTVGTEDQEPQNQNDRFDGEWGHCAIDFTHTFKFNAVYRAPTGDSWPTLLRGVFGGWQVGAAVNLHTGPWFNVIVSGNPANTSRGTIRPNLVGDPELSGSERSVGRWFNTSAFAAPAPFTFGNSPRNVLRGPATRLVDLNLQKRIRLGRQAIELRLDVYNAFNVAQFGIPNRTLGTPTFGQINTVGPARETQIGIRYTF